jgi:hypothetical protein
MIAQLDARSAMKNCAMAILAAALAAPALADEASAVLKTDIVGLTQKLMDAIGDGKKEVWERIVADDALITDEFGRRQTKRELVDSLRPLPPGFSGKIEVRDAHVRRYADTAVIDFEDYETESVFGQKFVVRYISTATYVRRDDAWKLTAMMDVTLPTQPPRLSVRDVKIADYPGTYRYGPERAFVVAIENGKLVYRTKAGRPPNALDAIAKDVFMGGDDEKNLLIFRRDEAGKIIELIERRKYNDLHMQLDSIPR